MTNFEWYWWRKIFWLFIIYNLSIGIDGHHNDTCQPAGGGQAFCVSKRYCREGFKEHLLPCIDGKVCCPLPTTPAPSTTTPAPVLTKAPDRRPDSLPRDRNRDDDRPRRPISSYDKPAREYLPGRPNEYERPKYDPRVDGPQDERPRRPSYERGRGDSGRPRYPEDDRPPSRANDGRPRRPIYEDNPPRRRRPDIDDYPPVRRPINRDYDDIPPRRPVDRPRQNRPIDDYPPRRDDERPRRPINRDYDDIPPRRPIERPRQNRPIDDYPPRRDDGRPRRPISRDYDDIPSRRPIDNGRRDYDDIPPRRPIERPRQNRPVDDYPPRRDDTRPKKPVDIFEDYEDDTKSVRDVQLRPEGSPRNEDRNEKPLTKPGKVKFEDEYLYEDRPMERPSGTETRATDNEDKGKPEFSIDPRRERPRQSSRGAAGSELPKNPRDDNYDRRTDDAPPMPVAPQPQVPDYFPKNSRNRFSWSILYER